MKYNISLDALSCSGPESIAQRYIVAVLNARGTGGKELLAASGIRKELQASLREDPHKFTNTEIDRHIETLVDNVGKLMGRQR
jgi:hypothetical protein